MSTMPMIKERILDYLRDEFKDDPEYSRKDIEDISSTVGVTVTEASEALVELQQGGKVYLFKDCRERHPDEWQAAGAEIVFED